MDEETQDEHEEGHHLEPLHDDEDMVITELDNDDQGSEHGNSDDTSLEIGADHRVPEDKSDDNDGDDYSSSQIQEPIRNRGESENDDEELPSREIDSDLNKSESLPSLSDSGEQSDSADNKNDRDNDQTSHRNGDQHLEPSQSVKQERHIRNALPDDIDLLAEYDDDSIASSQDANKLIWSGFQIAFLISAPVFFIGLALVIMGALNFPPTFNLLPIGIPVFIIAGIVFIGSTAYLCFYKAKKMRLFEFGGDADGEIAGIGNMGYNHETVTIPNATYDLNQEMPSHVEGDDNVFRHDGQDDEQGEGETLQSTVVYTTQDPEESLPL